jgi:hypothetical protein
MNGLDDRESVQQQAPPQRYTRRLSDKILIAFHQACDQDDIEVARCLLRVLECMAKRPPPSTDRRLKETLTAALERLWHLQHPEVR